MKNYDYKTRNLFSGPHLLGMLFIGAGIFSLVSPEFITDSDYSSERSLWIGVIALTFGLIITFTFTGKLISFEENKIKEYTSVLGFKMGEWIGLPNVKHIKLTSEVQTSSNTPNGISPTLSGNTICYKVLLTSSPDTNKNSYVLEFSSKDKAMASAQLLSKGFDVQLQSEL